MKHSRGQNLVEYVLLVTAVVVVCIVFLTVGPMRQSVNASLNSMILEINSVNSLISLN